MIKIVDHYLKFCRIINGIVLAMAGVVCIFMMLITNYDVFARNIFHSPGLAAVEIAGYCLTFLVFGGIAYTFMDDGFIRVTVVYDRVPAKAKKYLDVILFCIACFYAYLMAKFIWKLIAFSWTSQVLSNGITRWPLFWPRLIMGIGTTALLLSLIGLLAKQVLILFDKEQPGPDNSETAEQKTEHMIGGEI